ncbi:hypothetical protein R4I97_05685 [Brachyspira pilosicoli]|uniref:hypothetical protein n=1 Tax=Brachyspira pilosicoli TaxID=52584 RepID=UPI0030071031
MEKNNKQKNIIKSYKSTCNVNTKEENISSYIPKLPNDGKFTVLTKELCVHEYG